MGNPTLAYFEASDRAESLVESNKKLRDENAQLRRQLTYWKSRAKAAVREQEA